MSFSNSYNVREIKEDSNCLFRSISVCIYGTEDHYSLIRYKIVKHVVENWPTYNSFIIDDRSYGVLITSEKDCVTVM